MKGPEYDPELTRKQGSVVEGDNRQIGVLVVYRIDGPDAKPVKVAARQVRAWTWRGVVKKSDKVANEIVTADRNRLKRLIQDKIDRKTQELTGG